jgi:hypothetical protein
LPRLIRDQDVDTDLPSSVDHDHLSRSHVAFPLPGERSQVDSALCLFRISRIIASTMENLYTTTRRRGGVEKINGLQAELDMWAREIPLSTSVENGQTAGIGVESFVASLLQIVLCIATIHVHRPALSFTSPDPQITISLQRCTEASTTLINLLSAALEPNKGNSKDRASYEDGLLLCLLYPSGPHMLWQAGVNILYAHWKSGRSGTTNTPYTKNTSEDNEVVERCVQALRRLGDLTIDVKATSGDPRRLVQCATVLERLRDNTFPPRPEPTNSGGQRGATTPSATLTQENWDDGLWDMSNWPMESVLEFANSMNVEPLGFFPSSPTYRF